MWNASMQPVVCWFTSAHTVAKKPRFGVIKMLAATSACQKLPTANILLSTPRNRNAL